MDEKKGCVWRGWGVVWCVCRVLYLWRWSSLCHPRGSSPLLLVCDTLPPARTVTSRLRKMFPLRKCVPAKTQTHILENLGSLGLISLGKAFPTRNGGKCSLIYKRSDAEKVWCWLVPRNILEKSQKQPCVFCLTECGAMGHHPAWGSWPHWPWSPAPSSIPQESWRRLGTVGGHLAPRIHRSVSPGPVGSREGSFRLRVTS